MQSIKARVQAARAACRAAAALAGDNAATRPQCRFLGRLFGEAGETFDGSVPLTKAEADSMIANAKHGRFHSRAASNVVTLRPAVMECETAEDAAIEAIIASAFEDKPARTTSRAPRKKAAPRPKPAAKDGAGEPHLGIDWNGREWRLAVNGLDAEPRCDRKRDLKPAKPARDMPFAVARDALTIMLTARLEALVADPDCALAAAIANREAAIKRAVAKAGLRSAFYDCPEYRAASKAYRDASTAEALRDHEEREIIRKPFREWLKWHYARKVKPLTAAQVKRRNDAWWNTRKRAAVPYDYAVTVEYDGVEIGKWNASLPGFATRVANIEAEAERHLERAARDLETAAEAKIAAAFAA